MFRSLALLCLIGGCIASPLGAGRIVNGTDAQEGEIKYIVSLRSYSRHSCGASILDSRHVLTASHCVDGGTSNPSAYSIQYGLLEKTNDNTNSITAKEIIMHPNYAPWLSYANDVAVIVLEEDIPIGGNVQPIVLPEQGQATPGDQDAVLAGWGYPYSGGGAMTHLQRVDLTLYSDADCEKAHDGSDGNITTDKKYHVCAGIPSGGKGQCSGDSGGPLTVEGVQWGVVSWSIKPCAIKGKPGVFANVASYVNWIREQQQKF